MRVPDFKGALRARDSHFERELDGFSGLHQLSFFIEFQGVGQALVDVEFAAEYTQKPLLTSSYEVKEGQALGSIYPDLRAGVYKFAYREVAVGVRYYTGATVVVRVEGEATQVLIGHLLFTGVALANPGIPEGGITT